MENKSKPTDINKQKRKPKFTWLTIVLLICIIELAVSNINNINKNINFVSKIKGLENKRNEELDRNKQLKSELENFNSETTLESIARNNLKMAGKNEILIIMNEPQAPIEEDNEIDKGKKKK